MASLSRNDPCPCGSGRKYKRCCYARDAAARDTSTVKRPDYADPDWRRIRRTEGTLMEAVMIDAQRRYDPSVPNRAMQDFTFDGEFEPTEETIEALFFPWFVFRWVPESNASGRGTAIPVREPLALTWLHRSVAALDEYEQRFIRSACEEPFSFFVVQATTPGSSLDLRDLLLGRTVTVSEVSASQLLQAGDITFCHLVAVDGRAIMVGTSPLIIPPDHHISILDLRDRLRRGAAKSHRPMDLAWLRDNEPEIRWHYCEIVKVLLNPPEPKLRNTDGDPLVFAELHFHLRCRTEEALRRLKPLAMTEDDSDMLDGAEYAAVGSLRRATFPWLKAGNLAHRHWKNTVLGHLTVEEGLLTVEVNSEARAAKIRSELQSLLGSGVEFQDITRRPASEFLRKSRDRQESNDSWRERQGEADLSVRPELRAAVQEEMRKYWEAWLDQPIPKLKGLSPRRAARKPDTRERLEALLVEIERRNQDLPQPEVRADVGDLRRRLGLA